MKKAISIILILIITLSICLVSVGAEDAVGDLTQDMAEELAFEAYKALSILRYGAYYKGGYSRDNKPIVAMMSDYQAYGEKYYTIDFTESSEGVKYIRGVYSYVRFVLATEVPQEREMSKFYTLDRDFNISFKTISDVKVYLQKYFTEEMSNNALYPTENIHHLDGIFKEKYELFRFSESGEMLINFIDAVERPPHYQIEEFGELTVQESFAEMDIVLCKQMLEISNIYENVKFTKISDGWRVSGGTAFEVMLGDREPNYNPNTGDTASYTIPALTVAALISVALPVSIMKKRRRIA